MAQTPSVCSPEPLVKVEQDPVPPSQAAASEPSPSFSLVKYVGDLNGLSSPLSTFTQRWNDLESHLQSIHNSIQQHLQARVSDSAQDSQIENSQAHDSKIENSQAQDSQIENSQAQDSQIENSKAQDSQIENSQAQDSQIENSQAQDSPPREICNTGVNLRKYVIHHLNDDTEKLRDEVFKVLKRAPNPPKLVLDCVGRFYLQGSKAYSKEPHILSVRTACIFVLESFLLYAAAFSNDDMEPSVKAAAEAAAIAWRIRLVREGGIANACAQDALGLLLFVASFGIPSDFERLDLLELIRLSNLDKKTDALRVSPILIQRVQDMIQEMVNDGMHVAAVGLSCAFGLEGKFPPLSLLSSFIHETNQNTKKMREGQGSHLALKKANEKQLAALKSVIKCTEDHQLDRAELSSWKIDEKIANLEKDISNADHKESAALKRKAKPFSSEKLKTQEAKHHRPTSTQRHPPRVITSQEKSLHDGFASNSLPAGGFPGIFSGFSGPLAGPVAALSDMGLPPGKYLGALGGSGGGLAAGAGPSAASGVGFSLGNGVGSFPGIGALTNNRMGSQNWHGDGALNDYSGGQHSLLGLPSSAVQGGFRGLPVPMANGLLSQRSAGSDLYQFADTVAESEAQDSSRLGTATSAFYRQAHF